MTLHLRTQNNNNNPPPNTVKLVEGSIILTATVTDERAPPPPVCVCVYRSSYVISQSRIQAESDAELVITVIFSTVIIKVTSTISALKKHFNTRSSAGVPKNPTKPLTGKGQKRLL